MAHQHYTLAPANFSDYRDFLKSRFESLQARNQRFSLSSCALKAKISKSLLQFLFKKKRHIGLDKLPDLARCLKLTSDEEYFVCLMLSKSSSRNPEVQAHFERIMDRIRHQYIKVDVNEPQKSSEQEKRLYLNALFMVLQALTRLPDFREDHKWILRELKMPELTDHQVRSTLLELERLNYIRRDPTGRLKAKEESLWRPDPYDPSGQQVFTEAAEAVAKLMQTPSMYKPSVYMSMALPFDEEHLLSAEKFMIEVHHKLSALSRESKDPTAVAFVGNFFLTVVRLSSAKNP